MISPAALSMSRSDDRYSSMRAERISLSRIEAGIAKPCSVSMVSSSASTPLRFLVAFCQDVSKRGNAERIAIAAGVFGGDPASFFRDGDWNDPTRLLEFADPLTRAPPTLSPLAGKGMG